MTTPEIISLIASIASVILAVGAISLSITFFKMTSAASKATEEAAKGISASVERLEKIFDKLYSDTFSMMRETVTDMRKHTWKAPTEDAAGPESDDIRSQIANQIEEILESKGVGEDNTEEIKKELEETFQRMLDAKNEKKEKVEDDKVLEIVHALKEVPIARLGEILEAEWDDVSMAAFRLRQQDKVTWDGTKNMLMSDTVIKLPKNTGEQDSGDNA